MGASESSEQPVEVELKSLEEGIQDDVFPWFHVVQWCCEDSAPGLVMKWNLSAIQSRVNEITSSPETFMKCCPNSAIKGFTLDETTNFVEWAAALLDQTPPLCQVRYKLVPSRMKEDVFWQRFFSAIKREVQHNVAGGGHAAANEQEEHSGGI